jgi:hypothetical protein
MAIRHQFLPRGACTTALREPRRCILMTDQPVIAVLSSIAGNKAVLTAASPIAIGSRIELHHPEAGMLRANVVDQVGECVSLAFVAGNRTLGYALDALSRATRRPLTPN